VLGKKATAVISRGFETACGFLEPPLYVLCRQFEFLCPSLRGPGARRDTEIRAVLPMRRATSGGLTVFASSPHQPGQLCLISIFVISVGAGVHLRPICSHRAAPNGEDAVSRGRFAPFIAYRTYLPIDVGVGTLRDAGGRLIGTHLPIIGILRRHWRAPRLVAGAHHPPRSDQRHRCMPQLPVALTICRVRTRPGIDRASRLRWHSAGGRGGRPVRSRPCRAADPIRPDFECYLVTP
jgi:hypothetical protein